MPGCLGRASHSNFHGSFEILHTCTPYAGQGTRAVVPVCHKVLVIAAAISISASQRHATHHTTLV